MEGSFAVQTKHLSWNVFLLSIPVGLLVALVLFANNLRDRAFDSRKKIKTLATLTAPRTGKNIFLLLTGLPYGLYRRLCRHRNLGLAGPSGISFLAEQPSLPSKSFLNISCKRRCLSL
jgi:hypothetical protein